MKIYIKKNPEKTERIDPLHKWILIVEVGVKEFTYVLAPSYQEIKKLYERQKLPGGIPVINFMSKYHSQILNSYKAHTGEEFKSQLTTG